MKYLFGYAPRLCATPFAIQNGLVFGFRREKERKKERKEGRKEERKRERKKERKEERKKGAAGMRQTVMRQV